MLRVPWPAIVMVSPLGALATSGHSVTVQGTPAPAKYWYVTVALWADAEATEARSKKLDTISATIRDRQPPKRLCLTFILSSFRGISTNAAVMEITSPVVAEVTWYRRSVTNYNTFVNTKACHIRSVHLFGSCALPFLILYLLSV